jgi:copper homeostasis protein
MLPKRILEIACFNLESALIAEASGADRIELCENYVLGGLTPSNQLILETRAKVNIPIYVMIRPHAESFVYSDKDLKQMQETIQFCKLNHIDGVVFGVLEHEKNSLGYQVNTEACKILCELAAPMSITFHRAIDQCADVYSTVESLIDLGVHRVLSSGGQRNAMDGIQLLKNLQARFGKKITIMPGGAIRAENLKTIITSNCKEFHSAALLKDSVIADASEIKMLREILDVF